MYFSVDYMGVRDVVLCMVSFKKKKKKGKVTLDYGNMHIIRSALEQLPTSVILKVRRVSDGEKSLLHHSCHFQHGA